MRKILFLSFSMLYVCIASSQNACDKNALKISYQGKAPFTIDGKIDDWQSILGPVGNYPDRYGPSPYQPPPSSRFNWVLDRSAVMDNNMFSVRDRDQPAPSNDLHFMAFTNDDYNVYFYLRRQALSSDPTSFYYFLDLNDNGLMNNGEPVIHATFSNHAISALTLSRYVVNETQNFLDNTFTYDAVQQGNIMKGRSGVDKFPITGNLIEVMNSENIIPNEKPKKNEVFNASITEDGFGVELAIPWSYLKMWTVAKQKGNSGKVKYEKEEPLAPGDIFFYHASMQPDAGPYDWRKVVDNAGSCTNGLVASGNINLSADLTTTALASPLTYQFRIDYTNNTNASTVVETEGTITFKQVGDLPSLTGFSLSFFYDENCNGVADAGENTTPGVFSYLMYNSTLDAYQIPFTGRDPLLQTLAPHAKSCLVAKLTFPASAVKDLKVRFIFGAEFKVGEDPDCHDCGPKPINQVGFVETPVESEETLSSLRKSGDAKQQTSPTVDALPKQVILYPNPSKGFTNLSLPASADIVITDGLGRTVQFISKAKAGILQLRNLTPGFYLVKIKLAGSNELLIKKLAVQ